MTINKIQNKDKLTISITGRIDSNTAPELEKTVKELIDGIKELTFELEGLEYISSAGLRVLLMTQKIMNKQGTMKLLHVGVPVMEILEITGFTEILTIE